jgi:hypothetical protein
MNNTGASEFDDSADESQLPIQGISLFANLLVLDLPVIAGSGGRLVQTLRLQTE